MKIERTAGEFMAQDLIHVCKKLVCKLDSAKILELGYFTCCHSHLQHIYTVDASAKSCVQLARCYNFYLKFPENS